MNVFALGKTGLRTFSKIENQIHHPSCSAGGLVITVSLTPNQKQKTRSLQDARQHKRVHPHQLHPSWSGHPPPLHTLRHFQQRHRLLTRKLGDRQLYFTCWVVVERSQFGGQYMLDPVQNPVVGRSQRSHDPKLDLITTGMKTPCEANPLNG